MVVADPAAELLGLVRGLGGPAPDGAPASHQRAAALIRRRFGLALPPPFVVPPSDTEPVRPATAVDGAAIAAVKWRVFATSYRHGVLPDAFLDTRDVVPSASFWTGRAMVPPSRRHRLLVWGRPGTVRGYCDCGPGTPTTPATAAVRRARSTNSTWTRRPRELAAARCSWRSGRRLLTGA